MRKKRNRSIEVLKSRYGFLFTLPWTIGFIIFFLVPLVQSFVFAFCDVSINVGGIGMDFIGIRNFKYALYEDPNYISNLTSGITSFFYKFPFILVLSLIIAILLNQKFVGRLFFRSLYFLPVIIASGVVLDFMLSHGTATAGSAGVASDVSSEMFSISSIVEMLGLPDVLSEYIENIMNIIMQLVWSCGVQIVLFIAGMQAIPEQLYEVARVEGATKWETFWFVTFPMLSSVTVLVTTYTVIDLFTAKTDKVLSQAYLLIQSQIYGEGTAMLWIYFMIIGIVFSALILLFNRICMKKWQ